MKTKQKEDKMSTNYQVQVHAKSSWQADGSPVILRDCGHNHRTISGAARCLKHLQRRLSDGMYLADWYHANIYHGDGSQVDECYYMEAPRKP